MSNRALLPQWAKLPPKLRNHFADVWQRLPNSARVTLNESRPTIQITNTGERMAWAGILLQNGRYQYVLNVAPGLLDMPPWLITYTLAHELAHLVLRHPDHRILLSLADYSEAAREAMVVVQEDQANLQVILWGFRTELEQSVNPPQGEGEVMYRLEKPTWYDNWQLATMGGNRN